MVETDVGFECAISRRSLSGRFSVKSRKLFSVVVLDVVSLLLVGKFTSSSVLTRSTDVVRLLLSSAMVAGAVADVRVVDG